MPAHGFRPYSREPTEAKLREMLDARELEKELARKRMGRIGTVILLTAVAVLGALIFCIPDRRIIAGGLKDKPAATAAAVKAVSDARKNSPESKIPEELKPFSAKPGESNHHADIHFATELFQFVQPHIHSSVPSAQPAQPQRPKAPATPGPR